MNLLKKSKTDVAITASAKVVDGTLILSLPNAISPIVWRWDLSDVKASALEIREHEDQYKLVLKTPRGDVQDVAPFSSKDEALDALLKVGNAMERGSGQIKSMKTDSSTHAATPPLSALSAPLLNPNAQEDSNLAGTVLTGVAGLIVLGILLLWLGNTQPRIVNENTMPQTNAVSTQENITPSDQDDTTGVPVSADDILSGF